MYFKYIWTALSRSGAKKFTVVGGLYDMKSNKNLWGPYQIFVSRGF
jgi:hypothetical protein